MFSPSKSTPKMRRAMTPRVRSSHNLDNEPNKQPLIFTSQKYMKNLTINPQKVQEHLNKKLNLGSKANIDKKKIDIAQMQTDASVNFRQNNFLKNQQYQTPKNLKIGRQIQWNANQRPKNLNQYQQDDQNNNFNLKKNRCSSAHNLNSRNNYSQKSNKIKQDRKQFQQKFNVAFNYLLQQNIPYLDQRLCMCNQKARPKQQIFKIQKPNLLTTYKDFHRHMSDKYPLNIEPQNQKTALFISPNKVCGNSTMRQYHDGRYGKKADIAKWGEGFKLEGPMKTITTYQNHFPNHGQFQRMVPIATFNEHPLGMPHKQTSTHRRFFKGQYCPRSDLATWNNQNPMTNNFSPNRGTQYQNTHNFKQIQPIQKWPHPQHKLIITQGKFNTEFKDNYIDHNKHELNYQNRCRCGRKRH